MKIFCTPDVPTTFRTTLKCLTLFSEAELVVSSEKIREEYSLATVIDEIIKWKADLILTQSEHIKDLLIKRSNTEKILLLTKCDRGCDSKLLSNALAINSFLSSKASVFVL